MELLKRSWAEINLDAVEENVKNIKALLSGDCMLMGVVKADGYGHGDKYISDTLVKQGVNWFGVSNIDEALSLRRQGIFHPILIFGNTPVKFAKTLNEYNLTQTIYSLEYGKRLAEAAEEADVTLDVHLKVDTGMSRIGFVAVNGEFENAISEIAEICAIKELRPYGIYTHFPVADEKKAVSEDFTRKQYEVFTKLLTSLEKLGITFSIKHCCNSAATISYPEMHMDMVRTGIITYGLNPSEDCKDLVKLTPAMSLYSCITMVKKIVQGTSVSYGRTFIADREKVIATVPIGYADGIERELSDKAEMIVRGKRAKIVGRVCMDQLMLDVSDIEGVCEGDVVTIVGEDEAEKITFDEMAKIGDTINYEKICIIGKRVPRIYKKKGETIGVVDYIRSNVDL